MKRKNFLAVFLVFAMCMALISPCAMAESVTFTALEGDQTNSKEGYAMLIDGNINTKWGVGSFSKAQIIIKASDNIYVTGYTFTTGNDTAKYTGRNPKNWTLSVSNDYNESSKTGNWTPIHTVVNDSVLQPKNHTKFNFSTDVNNIAGQYYKLEITKIVSDNFMQLAEMEFIYTTKSCEHEWVESETAATCTEPAYKIEHCNLCNEEQKTEISPALGHNLDSNGICTRCGESCAAETDSKYFEDLQTAIDSASENSTVTMLKNIDIGSTLSISKNVKLDLNGFTLKMTGSGSVIKISNNRTFELQDSSTDKTGVITGGNAKYGGGIYIYDGTFNMTGGTISGCSATDGGGIYVEIRRSLNMTGGTISDCSANRGGGIFVYGGSGKTTVNGGTIENCTAELKGGGIFILGSTTEISNSTIENCTANGKKDDPFVGAVTGGGIYADAGTITINNNTVIRNNNAPDGNGGGIGITTSANITADNITIENNNAADGGGICISQYNNNVPSLTLTNSQITGNTATNGGGISAKPFYSYTEVTLEVNNCEIMGNTAYENGGGMWIGTSKEITLANSHISNNTSKAIGGGMYLDSNAAVVMNMLTVIGNTAVKESGGIACKTDGININGGAQIYSNYIAEEFIEGKEIVPIESNLCLYDGKKITVTNPQTYNEETGYISSFIKVSVINDEGLGLVTAPCSEDYMEFFDADNENRIPLYGDGAISIGIKVFVDCGNEMYETGVFKNGTLELDDPTQEGYFFGGWFADGNGYNFENPVTESFTITAKWLKEGENAVSITPQKVYVTSDRECKLYIGAYNNGKLTNIKILDSKPAFSWELSEIGLNTTNATKISAFLWDSKAEPLCESAYVLQ